MESEMPKRTSLSRRAFYPLADPIFPDRPSMKWNRFYRAVWTGIKRPPLQGEWYLSGAIVQAYRAPNDMTIAFPIARIAKVRIDTIITEENR